MKEIVIPITWEQVSKILIITWFSFDGIVIVSLIIEQEYIAAVALGMAFTLIGVFSTLILCLEYDWKFNLSDKIGYSFRLKRKNE